MSITEETLKQHLKDPAVLCCRREKGTVIGAHDLEDPTLFDDMVDAGLMTLKDDGLTIEEVVGATLIADSEALVQLTPDLLDGIQKTAEPAEKGTEQKTSQSVKATKENGGNEMLEININELKGLNLKVPQGWMSVANNQIGSQARSMIPAASESSGEKKVIRQLKKQYIQITDAEIGNETKIENGKMTVDQGLIEGALETDKLIKELKLDVIKPEDRHIYTDTIMDVCPIATKVEGPLGEGVTRICEGVVFMLTGVDEDGIQVHEFGSSEGMLDEKMYFGNPGCADEDDIIIRCHATIERLSGMSRPGPLSAHKAQDCIIQAFRDQLKEYEGDILREEIVEDVRRTGNKKVVLIKEIMGQGAMHDNVICPTEPCGVPGGRMNVDCGNVPIILTPNQVRDGAIHALTCIGPATKEMTRHYMREPLVEGLAEDEELDLVGVIFVGSPQVNDEKLWVSERLGTLLETLNVDGAIITTEGFGNNHIDFIEHIRQAGERNIPIVGASFCAYQGQLVVGTKYADAMIEENLDAGGFENDIAGTSCVTKEVATRAIQMLKNKIEGVEILPAKKQWDNDVINENNRLLGIPDNTLVESGTLH